MIPAAPTPFHRALIGRYFRYRLRRDFHSVAARGLQRLAPWSHDAGADGPLILLANHSSWWDAVLPIYLSLELLGQDAYGVMEEKQLARYRFFRRAGIFSIDRENPRSAMESLRYAAGLLAGRSRVLWLFPQGVILPNDRRPIDCSPGAAHLVGMLPKCTIAPVAFRYELLGEERPFAWVSIGEPIAIRSERRGSTRDLTAQIATILTAEADALRDDVVSARTGEFTDIIRSRRNREWRMEN